MIYLSRCIFWWVNRLHCFDWRLVFIRECNGLDFSILFWFFSHGKRSQFFWFHFEIRLQLNKYNENAKIKGKFISNRSGAKFFRQNNQNKRVEYYEIDVHFYFDLCIETNNFGRRERKKSLKSKIFFRRQL